VNTVPIITFRNAVELDAVNNDYDMPDEDGSDEPGVVRIITYNQKRPEPG
jgi:hypothetical protein